ncbi:tetratricopeptide repeat protein [Cytobacillus gottheilii]|uniref:tetratricopeptide repeat protein n=1 Tax=Cytobacillus gottheilii TaxID=859144 RepID=UPI003CEF194A
METLARPPLLQEMEVLPDHKTRDFELKLTKMAEGLEDSEYHELHTFLSQNIYTTAESKDILFSIFVLLATYARRMKNISQFKDLVEVYGEHFVDYPLYPHILSLLYKEIGTNEAIEQEMAFAREATQKLPNQVGVLHHYAEAVVNSREQGLAVSTQDLEEAYQTINRVVHLSPRYAKFHSTKGRVLAALGKYAEAKDAIRKAIDMEESTKKDYAIRINDYLYHLNRIQTNEFTDMFSEKITVTEKSLEESKVEVEESISKLKSENLQMLGFFTAIISFTIGSMNLLENRTFLESAFLILILSSSLVLAFVGFGFLFPVKKTNRRSTIWVSLAAVVTIIGSFLAYYFIK